MEKNMQHEMETGVIKGIYKVSSSQKIPTLGPEVYTYYLDWAIWILRVGSGVLVAGFWVCSGLQP